MVNRKEKEKQKTRVTEIFGFEKRAEQELPLFLANVPAGFPSPADDYIDRKLDLNEFLVKHPAATFFVRVEGESMTGAGIHSGDILIVDRALEPADRKIVIANVNGDLTVKRIRQIKNKLYLAAENPDFDSIEINEEEGLTIWGVVTCVLHQLT
ncbi:translesion error-prone DNA polymerase V autoproteolytic subunit [Candidatus Sumerlaeota bacterium]|nr:translesion error-prone DNA polymerase V autoproteolytic subunit [Candidatus Sumerlaeota bacterium]